MAAKEVRMRRGTTAENNAYTGPQGEVTVDTTQDTLRVHDGVTAGGTELARADLSNVSEDNALEARLLAKLQEMIANGGEEMSIGSVKMSYVNPGSDYLPANGSLQDKVEYDDLYEAIGDRYLYDGLGVSQDSTGVIKNIFSANYLDSAIAGNTLVVLGAANTLYFSKTGGRSWGVCNFPTTVTGVLTRVFTNGTSFVAVGTLGLIAYSADGQDWTVSNPTAVAFTQAFYLKDAWYAFSVATNNNTARSTDGVNWTLSTTPGFTTFVPNAALYVARLNTFILVGNAGALSTSTDGLTFTSRTSNFTTSNHILCIADNGSQLIIGGGSTGDTTATSSLSSDGITWSTLTTFAGTPKARQAIVWFNNNWVSVGKAGAASYSPDGLNWTKITPSQYVTAFNFVTLFAANGALYASVGPAEATSYYLMKINPDFSTETITMARAGSTPARVVYDSSTSTFWSIGSYQNVVSSNTYTPTFAMKSTDGQNYRNMFMPGGPQTLYSNALGTVVKPNTVDPAKPTVLYLMTNYSAYAHSVFVGGYKRFGDNVVIPFATITGGFYDGSKFVLYGPQNSLATSTDGFVWQDANLPINGQNFLRMTFFRGRYVAVKLIAANTYAICSSTDLTNWTVDQALAYGTFGMSEANGKLFVYYGNKLWMSDDGLTWTDVSQGLDGTINKVVYGNGLYVVTNATSSFATSDFSGYRKGVLAGITGTIQDVEFGNGVFVLCGGASNVGWIYSSYDGVAWTLRASPATILAELIFDGKGFVACSTYYNLVLGSNTGKYWSNMTSLATSIFTCYATNSYVIPGVGTTFVGLFSTNILWFTLGENDPTKFRLPTIEPKDKYDGDYYIKVR